MPDRLSNLPQPLCSRAVFTIRETGIVANLSERGVYNKFEAGVLNWVRHDGKRLVEREELIRYLDGSPFRVQVPKDFDPDAVLNEAVEAMSSA